MSNITSLPYFLQVSIPFRLQPWGGFGMNQIISDPTVISAINGSSFVANCVEVPNPDFQRPEGSIISAPNRAQAITANGQTIVVNAQGKVVLTTALGAGVTGLLMQKGTADDQTMVLLNNSAQSMTFAAVGTSNVQGGTGTSIAAGAGKKFEWDAGTAAWWAT